MLPGLVDYADSSEDEQPAQVEVAAGNQSQTITQQSASKRPRLVVHLYSVSVPMSHTWYRKL